MLPQTVQLKSQLQIKSQLDITSLKDSYQLMQIFQLWRTNIPTHSSHAAEIHWGPPPVHTNAMKVSAH